MSREKQNDKQEDFSNSYDQLFQTSSRTAEQQIADAEVTRARQEAIVNLENYQKMIKNRQETIAKAQEYLARNNLSPHVRAKGIIRLQALEAELAEHQASFASLMASDSGLTAHFSTG